MTTVAEMIEWLKTLPQDAEVECGVEMTFCGDKWIDFRPVNINYCEILDCTSDQFRIEFPDMYGRTIIQLQGA